MEQISAVVRVAACQMTVTADVDENFERIREAMGNAADGGARLLALPECALSGYPPLHCASPDDIDTVRIAERNSDLCAHAREHGIWVVLGTVLMSSNGLLNAALVISDEGEIVGRYDKLHLMPDDRIYFTPGSSVPLFFLGDLPFGVQICYDARFPEGFRYLRECGAQMVVVISNACGRETWKLPVLEGTYRARASENTCFIIAVNAAGPLQMATSRILDPLGLDLAAANQDRQEMLFADLRLSDADSGYFNDRRSDLFELVPKWEME